MPNKQRKMPLNNLGLLTTTTRITIRPSRQRSLNPHRTRATARMAITHLAGNRKQASNPTPNDTKHTCTPLRLRRFLRILRASPMHPLCLITRYARSGDGCQSFEKYSIKRPVLKERQASSSTHSLLTHSAS